ncbi:MAG: ATP-binding protein, partial [Anaerolineae bacterium]
MTREQLDELIRQGASETLEFKKSTASLDGAAETLCAFLNARGGTVLIGVTDRGKIVGQDVSDSTLREIAGVLSNFEPPADVAIERIRLDSGKEVLALRANPGDAGSVYAFNGRPYQRVGSTTSVMPQERYQQLLLERVHSRRRWENEPATGYSLEDLDEEEILRTLRLGVEAGRLPETTTRDLRDILSRLGLWQDGRLLNAAVVLFGTRFLPYYTQCQLRMARFRGTDKSEFMDQKQIEGHAFALLEEAMTFLRRHLPVAGRIQPGLFERQDEPLFPPEALREALVNAFCHRDYSQAGGAISLAIYDDRLEVWSNGTLPFGLTVEDLKRDHPSRPRNPLIAQVFYNRKLVERWGRGTQKIVELCVRAGHPEPEFVEQAGAVGVRFLPNGYIAPHRVPHDLSQLQREILHVLSGVPNMAIGEIRNQLSDPIPERTLRDYLTELRTLNLVGSEGRGRGAVW